MPAKTTNLFQLKDKVKATPPTEAAPPSLEAMADLAAALMAFEKATSTSPATSAQIASLAAMGHPKTAAALSLHGPADATPLPDVVMPLARPSEGPAKAKKRP